MTRRRIFTGVIALVAAALALGGLAAPSAQAAGDQTIYLKGSGANFTTAGWQNVFYLGGADTAANPSAWHLVYTGDNAGAITSMQVTFTNGQVFKWDPSKGFSTNGGGNNLGWIIVAPADWAIAYVDKGNNNESASFLVTAEAGNLNFNISGFHQGTAAGLGSVQAAVNATLDYTLTTTTQSYQRTIQPIWQKTYRHVAQNTIYQTWQKTTQTTYIPSFKRPTASYDTTLVTRLKYTNETSATATPTNGGSFTGSQNGQTYVTLNVADLLTAGARGFDYPIGDSSPNNGKKTPAQYNLPVGASYNVRLDGDKLVISWVGDSTTGLIGWSIGAYVQNKVSEFPGNAPKHVSTQPFEVKMPANYGATVYLYVHFASLSWYTSGNYLFTGWVATGTQAGEQLKATTKTTTAQLPDELVSDQWLRNEVSRPELVDEQVDSVTTSAAYAGSQALSCTNNSSGAQYDSSTAAIADMAPGVYTCTLTGDYGVIATDANVVVVAGQTTELDFGDVTITGQGYETVRIHLAPNVKAVIYAADAYETDTKMVDPIVVKTFEAGTVTLPGIYLGTDNPNDQVNKDHPEWYKN